MDWKQKITDWCKEGGVPAPTFLLTQRELRRILLRGDSKGGRFTQSERTLRHEFFHCLNEHCGYFNERMVEDQAKKFEKRGKIEGSTWVMLQVRICRYSQVHHATRFWTKGTKGTT